ncbi:MAG: hypothetical protein J6M12_03185 [Clostridia bacterium]|nr:hypothetical protein [Clostridia bacterium]
MFIVTFLSTFIVTFLSTLLVTIPISAVIGLVLYILGGIGIMKLSQKLGMNGGALGWVPYARFYQLGKIADELQRASFPEKKDAHWRVWLLVCFIAQMIPVLGSIAYVVVLSICSYKIFRELAYTSKTWMTVLSVIFPFLTNCIIFIVLGSSKKYPVPSPEYAAYLAQWENAGYNGSGDWQEVSQ